MLVEACGEFIEPGTGQGGGEFREASEQEAVGIDSASSLQA